MAITEALAYLNSLVVAWAVMLGVVELNWFSGGVFVMSIGVGLIMTGNRYRFDSD